MISMLRKLRQKLLSENKFSKYLLYAIGEIVLVVIGILIALQINNWSEQQKTKQKELNYLSLLRQEMAGNLHTIQLEKKVLNDFLTSLKQLLKLYANPDSTITNKGLSKILVPILSHDMDFYFKDGTLKEVISTGNLKDIANDSIRNILASINGNLERVRAQEKRVNDYIEKGNTFLEKYGSIKQMVNDLGANEAYGIPRNSEEKSNLFLLKNEQFESIMVFASLTGVNLNEDYYIIFEEQLRNLIDLIDKERKP